MRVKLIAFDMDGTALSTGHKLLPQTRDALCAARREKIILVPASGRMVSLIPDEVLSVPKIRYVISSNGASVTDRCTGEVIYSNPLPQTAIEELFRMLAPMELYLEIYAQGRVYMERSDFERFYRNGLTQLYPAEFSASLYPIDNLLEYARRQKLSVEKINLPFIGLEKTVTAAEIIRKIEGVALTTSGFDNLEINAAGTSKARALQFLCEHLAIPSEDIMAVGDGDNDLEMLRFAGVGVAMENAVPQVREAADFITSDNDHDGLGEAIRRFALCQDR